MIYDKDKIKSYLDSSKGNSYLSMNRLYELFNDDSFISYDDRSMMESFFRNELKIDPITFKGFKTIVQGMYNKTDDLVNLTIPAQIKEIAPGAFKGSTIKKITIEDGALGGKVDFDAFAGAENLEILIIPRDTIEMVADKSIASDAKHNRIKFQIGITKDVRENASKVFNTDFIPYFKDNTRPRT